jgi:hypothetical protein
MERCVTNSVELYCSTPHSVTYRQHELQPERPPDNEINTQLVSTLKSSACGQRRKNSRLGYVNVCYSEVVFAVRIDETVPMGTIFPCDCIFYENREYCHDAGGVCSWLMVRFFHRRLKNADSVCSQRKQDFVSDQISSSTSFSD